MSCPACGANATMFDGAVATLYACGFTPEDVATGRHSRRPTQLQPWAFAGIAFVAIIVWSSVWEVLSPEAGIMGRVVVVLQVFAVFALYALWRIVRALEGGARA